MSKSFVAHGYGQTNMIGLQSLLLRKGAFAKKRGISIKISSSIVKSTRILRWDSCVVLFPSRAASTVFKMQIFCLRFPIHSLLY